MIREISLYSEISLGWILRESSKDNDGAMTNYLTTRSSLSQAAK